MCRLAIGMIRISVAVACLQIATATESPAQQKASTTFSDSLRPVSHEKYYRELYRLRPDLLGAPAPRARSFPTFPFPFPNVNISNDTFPQNEPSVAISHKDPNRMVATWRDFRTGVSPAVRRVAYSYSGDGGVTWSSAHLLPTVSPVYTRNSDPAVCVDTSGVFYLSTLTLDNTNNLIKVFVYVLSEDGNFLYGGYFAPSDTADIWYDKEYIACDLSPTSPFVNNLYVAYDISRGVGFSRSTDGGMTWSHGLLISDSGAGNIAPDIAIGPDGSIGVAWRKFLGSNDTGFVLYSRSTDGGLTFSTEAPIDSPYPMNSVSFRGNFPSIAADISKGPHGGNIYAVWSDRRNADLDVFVSISADGGRSWSKARRVNDDPIGNGKHQFWPWIAVDDRGVISVVFYDTRNTPDSTIAETYLAYSWDGGLTFTNRLISSAQSPQSMPNGDVRFGDYIGIDSWGGHTVPVWTDERAGGYDMDIYTANLDTLPMVKFSGVAVSIASGWSLVSLPVLQPHNLVSQIFPSLPGPVFSFEGGSYQPKDTLKPGLGYWMRQATNHDVLISGDTVRADTVEVAEGWNLIGSITIPVPAGSITSIPPAMVTSQLFGYDRGYKIVDTLIPGGGYWIKTTQPGQLIIGESGAMATAGRVLRRILSGSPPPPPEPAASADVLPKVYRLEQAFPDPFNPMTRIKYELPVDSRVTLRIFNILGQIVATLVDNVQQAGDRQTEWNASGFASGVYFYQLEAASVASPGNKFTGVKKMILLK